jgi:hypothetical protein
MSEDLIKRQKLIIEYMRNKLVSLKYTVRNYPVSSKQMIEELTRILNHIDLIENSKVSMAEYEELIAPRLTGGKAV